MGLVSRILERLRRDVPQSAIATASYPAVDSIAAAEALHRAGNVAEARVLYERILVQQPDHAQALYFLGLVHGQEGKAAAAAALLERAISLGLDTPQVFANLGTVYLSLDRLNDAEAVLRQAASRDETSAQASATLGVVLARKGHRGEAAALLTRARAMQPGSVEILNNLGTVLRDLGRFDEALESLRSAVALKPDDKLILRHLGYAELGARQWHDAVVTFRRVIALEDRDSDAWRGLGIALAELGESDDAEAAAREAVALDPDSDDARSALARVLTLQGEFEEAGSALRTLLDRSPMNTVAWRQLAATQFARLQLSDAEKSYRRALEIEPHSAVASFDLAHFLLAQRQYEEGFALFESRFQAIPGWFTDELRTAGMDDSARRWRGESLQCKHIHVLGEQGFGDQIMVLRYLPMLKKSGAVRVSVTCSDPLLRLVRSVDGVDEVFSLSGKLRPEGVDVVVPAMSLPLCFGSSATTLPPPASLSLDTALKEAWLRRSQHLAPLRVGLSWAGKSTSEDPQRRIVTLETLRPILEVGGVSLVSLQKDAPVIARCGPADRLDRTLIDACDDFLDTACLVSSLDLVISVDTAVAHLAATLGVPTWLMLKTGGEWRWGAVAPDSVWYPSMRLFRQAPGAAWDEVAHEVAEALRTYAEHSRERLSADSTAAKS